MIVQTSTGIPSNIGCHDIRGALSRIDEIGVVKERKSRRWDLIYNGRKYPPKYVISLANEFANGIELDPSYFRSRTARRRLKSLGFTIVRKEY